MRGPAIASSGTKRRLFVNTQMTHDKGRVAVPMLLWLAGVPFTLVFLLWLFFFRGH